jgi:hypothetical protein
MIRTTTLASAAALAVFAGAAAAQCNPAPDRFCVTFGASYLINSISRPTITLIRGEMYTFQMVNVPSLHPFYLTTSSTGGAGGQGRWLDGVNPGTSVSGNQAMTFEVPMHAPDTLFYQCSVHSSLGGRIEIIDAPCAPDFNQDGFLDFFDYDAYVACFEDTSMCHHQGADFNGDGFVDFFDYDAFVSAFEAGC